MNLQGITEMKMIDQKGEWETVTRQHVFVSTGPPPVTWRRSENAEARVIRDVSLTHQSVFIRIGGLCKRTECFQSRHASNCHRPSVLSHLPAFLSLSLYFITYWLTSWVLQVHKSHSFNRLLGFCVCRLRLLEKIDTRITVTKNFIFPPSVSYARVISKDSVIMMKQI